MASPATEKPASAAALTGQNIDFPRRGRSKNRPSAFQSQAPAPTIPTGEAEPDETDVAGVAVYSGRDHIGDVRDRAQLAEAVTPGGIIVGHFENRRAATDALIEWAKAAR